MTMIYMPSAVSDKIVEFFNTYKLDREYKYVDDINSSLLLSREIVINYNEFTPEIKSMLKDQSNENILSAFERAIGEMFQARHGSPALESIKRDNGIKFKFIHWEKFEEESTFTPTIKNPESMEQFENQDKVPIDKIIDFIHLKTAKIVRSKHDTSKIYAKIEVNDHYETFEIDENSTRLILWLKNSFKKQTGKIYATESFKQAIEYVKGDAFYNENTKLEKINHRVAFDDKVFYYDSCSHDNKFIKITKDGVEVVSQDEDTPLFVRTQLQAEQVKPNLDFKGEPLNEFCKLNRLPKYYAVHLVAYLFPDLICCLALLSGPSGSFKTTTSGQTKRIIDPKGDDTNTSQQSSIPEKLGDLILELNNNYFIVFENVSYITKEISDIFCKCITGSAFSKKKNYADLEQILMKIQRKILVNGIEPNFTEEDLVNRLLPYTTKIPTQQETLTDEDVEKIFVKLRPDILGQIFFVIMKVINTYDSVKKDITFKPRMASFLVMGETIGRALGFEPNEYVDWFKAQTESALTQSNETSPLIPWLTSKDIDDKMSPKYLIQFEKFQNKLSSFGYSGNYDTTSKGLPSKPRQVRKYLKSQDRFLDQNGYKYEIIDRFTEEHPEITKGSAVIVFSRKNMQSSLGDLQ